MSFEAIVRSALAALTLVACMTGSPPCADEFWQAAGDKGVVVAGGPGGEAAQAGVAVLREGGNAYDAAAAMLLTLSAVDPGNFCFGGEVPILVYDAQREAIDVIAGQGAAPRLATLERFQAAGGIPTSGPTTAAIPGAFDAILTLLDRGGTISFRRASEPMLKALDAKTDAANQALARTIRELVEAEGTARERRAGLRRVADYFYRGPIARRIDAWSQANGGLLRYSDLATHSTRVEDPVVAMYRGHVIVKCGPWTQGPALLQTLQILEGFELQNLSPTSPEFIHLAVESLKLALADRDRYYADPLFVDVPLAALLDPSYAAQRRQRIERGRASLEYRPGEPIARRAGPLRPAELARPTLALAESQRPGINYGPQRDTATCLVADALGNVIAATPSGWGGVVAGDTGIPLGSRLRSLNTIPGHPNCVEPGKRPRITLTPTFVLKERRPVLAISVAGGDLQDQVTLQLLTACLDFGRSPAEAVRLPRFSTSHHVGSFNQPPPKLGELSVNEELGNAALARLREWGHRVELAKPPIGHPSVLRIDPVSGKKEGAGDPLARRHAAAE